MDDKCYVCGTIRNLHRHHVFHGTSNRKQSEKFKMVVYLCGYHHNLSNEGVHFNKKLDLQLKQEYQVKWESQYGSREEFRKVFRKSYIEE